MSWRFGQSSVVASRTHVWLGASKWNTDIVSACACVVPAGSAKASVADWSRRCTGAPLARLVAFTSYTGPNAVMSVPIAGGAVSGATAIASLSLLAAWMPTTTLPSDELTLPLVFTEDPAVAVVIAVYAIDGLRRTTWYW